MSATRRILSLVVLRQNPDSAATPVRNIVAPRRIDWPYGGGLAAVLQAKKLNDQAVIHAQRAVAIDPENEVGWYRLAQIQKALGNNAEQEKALAEYRRLHDRSSQQRGLEPVFFPREVTKQEVEPSAQ